MNHPASPLTALRILAAGAVIIALASCADGRPAGAGGKDAPLLEIHGPVTMSFCRLDHHAQGEFGGYAMVGALKRIPARNAAEILARLNDRSAYESGSAGCFEPGMGLEIVQGTDRYQLVICLWCANLIGFKNGAACVSASLGKDLLIFMKSVYFDGTLGAPAWE